MKSVKHILCPVDFSPNSYATIEKATFLARLYGADLTLLHIINFIPRFFGLKADRDHETQNIIDANVEQARLLLREAKRHYIPFSVTSKSSVRVGNVVEEILAEADEREVDLLILAAHGASDGEGSALGDFTAQLLARAKFPVITLPPASGSEAEIHKGFRNLLVVADRITDLWAMGPSLDRFFESMDPQLILGYIAPESFDQGQIKSWKDELNDIARDFKSRGFSRVKTEYRSGMNPIEKVQELVMETKADLLAVALDADQSGLEKQLESPLRALVGHSGIPIYSERMLVNSPAPTVST